MINSQAGVNASLNVAKYFTVPGGLTSGRRDRHDQQPDAEHRDGRRASTTTRSTRGHLFSTKTRGLISPDQISFTGLSSISNNSPPQVVLTLGNSLLHTATFTSATGTNEVSFDGGLELPFDDASQLNIHGNGDNDTVFVNGLDSAFNAGLTIDTLGASSVVTLGTSLDLDGALAITAGTINLNAASIATNSGGSSAGSVTLSGPVTCCAWP